MSEANKTVLKTLGILALGYVVYSFYRSNQSEDNSNAIRGESNNQSKPKPKSIQPK